MLLTFRLSKTRCSFQVCLVRSSQLLQEKKTLLLFKLSSYWYSTWPTDLCALSGLPDCHLLAITFCVLLFYGWQKTRPHKEHGSNRARNSTDNPFAELVQVLRQSLQPPGSTSSAIVPWPDQRPTQARWRNTVDSYCSVCCSLKCSHNSFNQAELKLHVLFLCYQGGCCIWLDWFGKPMALIQVPFRAF